MFGKVKPGLTYEEWFEQFQPIRNTFDPKASFDGYMYETYDQELEFVKQSQPDCIWTLVETSDGGMNLTNGFHLVNRAGYLIANKPYTGKDFMEIVIFEGEDPEDSEIYAV